MSAKDRPSRGVPTEGAPDLPPPDTTFSFTFFFLPFLRTTSVNPSPSVTLSVTEDETPGVRPSTVRSVAPAAEAKAPAAARPPHDPSGRAPRVAEPLPGPPPPPDGAETAGEETGAREDDDRSRRSLAARLRAARFGPLQEAAPPASEDWGTEPPAPAAGRTTSSRANRRSRPSRVAFISARAPRTWGSPAETKKKRPTEPAPRSRRTEPTPPSAHPHTRPLPTEPRRQPRAAALSTSKAMDSLVPIALLASNSVASLARWMAIFKRPLIDP
ncbi:PREDICTED: vegetative cell wall protein gp1-like [Cyphomyrmex costatus]|uniref:vegetative cell wall protein gp1-like n=1 Tax=Cyphomyrmex costatus TaxID=456900 RepID=UPI00085234C5|nr:PREDICTED: vegetative cell wall protein gp1-like [Cyphomyrmex costatus]